MKKSARVTLTFLSSFAALAIQACENDSDWVEARRCVDNNYVVVEDRLCDENAGGHYHHYYGGHGYYPGQTVYGGSSRPNPNVRYESPSRIARGGFGSTGRAFVGGAHAGA